MLVSMSYRPKGKDTIRPAQNPAFLLEPIFGNKNPRILARALIVIILWDMKVGTTWDYYPKEGICQENMSQVFQLPGLLAMESPRLFPFPS